MRDANSVSNFDVLRSLKRHIDLLEPWAPERMVACAGDYLTRLFLKRRWLETDEDVFTAFFGKAGRETVDQVGDVVGSKSFFELPEEVSTSLWLDVWGAVTRDGKFFNQLRSKILHRVREVLIACSMWDGVGAGLTPALISQFNEWKAKTLALLMYPSEVQPIDAHFNALSCLGKSLTDDRTPLVVVSRDEVERYVAVDEDGVALQGSRVVNRLVEWMLRREEVMDEIRELSRSFDVKVFTVLPVLGASLKIYGSIENILTSSMSRPLLAFNGSEMDVAYIQIRIPVQLKDEIDSHSLELSVADWFNEQGEMVSVNVGELWYTSRRNDRIDLLGFVGCSDPSKMLPVSERKVDEVEDYALAKEILTEEEWRGILGGLQTV